MGARKKILWSGSCKHYGFVWADAPEFNENNHYLAEVVGSYEKGEYLNSQNIMSRYKATRRQIGRFWFNTGHVTGYFPEPVWFFRIGWTGDEYEYSCVPNPFNLSLITMRTKYRWVEESEDVTHYTIGYWLKNKLFRKKDKKTVDPS